MKRIVILCLILGCAGLAFGESNPQKTKAKATWIGGSYPSGAKLKVAPDLDRRLAQFKRVELPFHKERLSAREVKLVEKLVEASRYIDAIYWRQNDPEGLTLYEQLRGSTSARDAKIMRFLFINGGRFDLTNENKPFVGNSTFEPGRGWYSSGLTREQVEKYASQHPEKRSELYSPYTLVRRRGDELEGLPYRVAYRAFLQPAANALKEAAALSDDAAFAEFLTARAEALLADDYYKSDLLWVELKNPKIDLILAPYETYLDGLLGVKASFGAAVLIRDDAESEKLAGYQKYIADIQDALPLAKEDRPDKHSQPMPMEVVNSPFRAGDLLHGHQTVADNLPNDARIRAEKGTKRIFFKNFMDARVNYVILPVAKRLMRADQALKATADGYLTVVVMHEISHGLGPSYAHTREESVSMGESIGPAFAALEEAKADITGLFGIEWMAERGGFPARKLGEVYLSYLAGIFCSVRLGIGEPHGRAQMAEFNYLMEKGAIRADTNAGDGQPLWVMDEAKMPAAIAGLAKELLETEATGDRNRAEQWFAKYDKMPAELERRLGKITEVPVDIDPKYSFAERVE